MMAACISHWECGPGIVGSVRRLIETKESRAKFFGNLLSVLGLVPVSCIKGSCSSVAWIIIAPIMEHPCSAQKSREWVACTPYWALF